MSPVPLSTLSVGQKGAIAGLNLPPALRTRFFEMGLTLGSSVELIRFAPLGDPLEVRVRGYYLSLRKSEAAGIQVLLDSIQ